MKLLKLMLVGAGVAVTVKAVLQQWDEMFAELMDDNYPDGYYISTGRP